MVDLFEEVDEHLRSDHYLKLAKRSWPWIVGSALAIALAATLGVWGFNAYREQEHALKASLAYARGLDDLSQGATSKAFGDFSAAADDHSPVYRSLALMQEAAIRQDQKRATEAIALFDEGGQGRARNPVIGDAARLKSAFALLDTAPYAVVEARLTPLADEKRPYFALAREALGMAKLRAGRTADARGDFAALSLLADAPDDVRQRAKAAMAMIDTGGTASAVADTVKAAVLLPPPPPTPANAGPAAGQADQKPTGRSRPMIKLQTLGLTAALLAVAVGGAGCAHMHNPFAGGAKKSKYTGSGERIPIIALDQTLHASDSLKGQDFYLPPPQSAGDWPLPGGNSEQAMEHVDAAPDFQIAWRRSFGRGSDRSWHVTATPVAADGRIYTMDGGADVAAFNPADGREIWRRDVAVRTKRDKEAFGGKVHGLRRWQGVRYGRLPWRRRSEGRRRTAGVAYDGR